jgi:hypothetical protein
MIKHFPVNNIYYVSIHILTSITITYSIVISVIYFKTVNASGTFVLTVVN